MVWLYLCVNFHFSGPVTAFLFWGPGSSQRGVAPPDAVAFDFELARRALCATTPQVVSRSFVAPSQSTSHDDMPPASACASWYVG